MWLLEFKTLLVGFWACAFVIFPVGVIVFIEVPGVVSFDVWEDDGFGFPLVIVLIFLG